MPVDLFDWQMKLGGEETKCLWLPLVWPHDSASPLVSPGESGNRGNNQLASFPLHYSQPFLMAVYRVVKSGTKTQYGACLCSKSLWPYFSYDPGCQKALQTKVFMHVGLILLSGNCVKFASASLCTLIWLYIHTERFLNLWSRLEDA